MRQTPIPFNDRRLLPHAQIKCQQNLGEEDTADFNYAGAKALRSPTATATSDAVIASFRALCHSSRNIASAELPYKIAFHPPSKLTSTRCATNMARPLWIETSTASAVAVLCPSAASHAISAAWRDNAACSSRISRSSLSSFS